jgi:hypothetical protein
MVRREASVKYEQRKYGHREVHDSHDLHVTAHEARTWLARQTQSVRAARSYRTGRPASRTPRHNSATGDRAGVSGAWAGGSPVAKECASRGTGAARDDTLNCDSRLLRHPLRGGLDRCYVKKSPYPPGPRTSSSTARSNLGPENGF